MNLCHTFYMHYFQNSEKYFVHNTEFKLILVEESDECYNVRVILYIKLY